MPLSLDERQRLQDEEVYRLEVRRHLEAAKPPAGVASRVSAFLETKVGFWLLTTLFVGASATVYTTLTNWLNRADIARQLTAERARQDFDTVIKVVPMLTSENAGSRLVGFTLLNGLASANSIQPEIAAQITSTLQSLVSAGAAPGASAEVRARADELVRLVDAVPMLAARPSSSASGADARGGGAAATGTPIAPAIVAVQLPPRVYVQISSEARRVSANRAVQALSAAGVLAPSIERVRQVPRNDELRYCEEKMLDESRDAVMRALKAASVDPALRPLAPRLCGNVRPNHFELWLADPER